MNLKLTGCLVALCSLVAASSSQAQLLAAKDAHDELAGALSQARQFSSEDLDQRVRELEQRLKAIRQQLDHADNNSYARLREEFSQADVDRLMRLFNGQLFSLPLGPKGVELSEDGNWVKTFESILARFQGDRLELVAGTAHDAIVGPDGVTCLEAHLPHGSLTATTRRPAGSW